MELSTTQAHTLAIVTQIVGFIVAFVPSLKPETSILIAVGSVVLSAVILIAHAIRTQPTSGASASVEEVAGQVLKMIEAGK